MNSAYLVLRNRDRYRKQGGGLVALRLAMVVIAIVPIFLVLAILGLGVAVFGVYATYARELPSPEEIGRLAVETFETTRIYDRTGQTLLYELVPATGGRRTWVPLSQISEHVRNATITMEDKTFYTNLGGINLEGLGRAVWGVVSGDYAGGGSSIHQQLVRNVIMTFEERMERSYARKMREIVLAIELDRRYPGPEGRDLILEWYLNTIFYGQSAYGIEAAAQTYFGKSAADLNLAEAAMLVPLPNAPALNPIDRLDEAKRRQEIVIDAMQAEGYVTAEGALAAKLQPVVRAGGGSNREDPEFLASIRAQIKEQYGIDEVEPLVIAPGGFDLEAPHFALYVRERLEKLYGAEAVYGGGLTVITSIDLVKQEQALALAREQIDILREKHNANNAAVVMLDTKTAEILAMVGSLDYGDESIDGNVNMAISPRQPGSSFKPFTYATAFAQGYTPASMVMDMRTSFPDPPNPAPYVPENYSRSFHGPMPLRRALASSYNVPAVAMMSKVGSDNVVQTAHRMGINTLRNAHYGLSLTLGGGEVTLLDMVYAFTVFGNGGDMLGEPIAPEDLELGFRRLDPVAILKVTDARGNTLYEYREPRRQQVIRPEVAYLITDILSDNRARTPGFGENSVLNLEERPAAVKTGTTNDFHDGWTIGFTPQYAVGVWVGNADYEPMENASGVRAAGPIWNRIMTYLHDGLPVENFERPEGLVTAVVDGTSGKLPTDASPWRTQELFIEGTVPTEKDDIHRAFNICKASGKLATVYCPPEEVERVVFEIYPPEADDWVREQEIPQPPTEFDDVHGPNLARAEVAIVSPGLFDVVSGVVPITGNARSGGLQKYWVQFGPGMDPSGEAWRPIGPEHGNGVDNSILEQWDTQGLTEGLFTLRLSVIDGGGLREAAVPVLVDNISPTVTILNPEPDKVYELGKDEWINIQAYATDNTAMAHVEFFLDDRSLGYTTVAPYTLRWTLAMSDTKPPSIDFGLAGPVVEILGEQTIRREVTEEGERRIYTHSISQGEAITVTQAIRGPGGVSWRMSWPNGRSIISNGDGYAETHTIHVVAYDAAGNQMKSDPVAVQVIHERKDEDKEARALGPIWRRPEG
jgi:membrane peptidoglycan carboxypeptidase